MQQLAFPRSKEWHLPALFILSIWLSSQRSSVIAEKNGGPEDLISGDITLGGLFSLRTTNLNGECLSNFSLKGVKCLEAMLFAVDRINADDTILPNITLGVKAYDTCRRATIALDRVLKYFVFGSSSNFSRDCSSENPNPVVGVIGPSTSHEAIYIAKVLGIFKIPLISYGATSLELSDKSKYKYFSRTIPSDVSQAKAIVQILKNFNWTYVSIVYTDESYGRLGFDLLKEEAKNHGKWQGSCDMILHQNKNVKSDFK